MNADTSQIFQPNLALGLLLTIGLVLVAFIVALFTVRRYPSAVRAIVIGGGMCLTLLVFAGFTGTAFVSLRGQIENPRVEPQEARPVTSSLSKVDAKIPVTTEEESLKSTAARPEWTRQKTRVDGRKKFIVVSSGRFASEEEVELHGIEAAAAVAVKEFALLDPRGIGAVQPQHFNLVKENAIKRRFSEVAQTDFGKFQGPMQKLWLEVELTPELGERLAEPWRQAAVDARLRTLGTWGLCGTVAAALAAFGLRLDSVWKGRHRAAVGGMVVALALGSLAFWA